ncbi:MAG TPA: TetR family transcriptional regulator [Solirubrobacteraceae bacterium]|jgi:AcrR family transcriptional regulator
MAPPTTAQTEKAEETRRRIVLAAAELFATHGYSATSLSAVIAAAGSTKGGFYFHFASKADLGLAVVAQARAQFTADVLAASGEYTRASDELVAMVRAIAANSKDTAAASGLGRLCMELREEPAVAAGDLDPYGSWVALVEGLLVRAARDGDLDPAVDTREAARYAVGAFVGVESLAGENRDDFLERIDDHLRLTHRALGLRSLLLDNV